MSRRPNDQKIEVVNVRLVKEPSLYSTEKIRSPDDAVRVIADELATLDRETFSTLCLKASGQILTWNVCSVGTLDASLVHPRELFKGLILSNSCSYISIHNHPGSGHSELKPSSEDIAVVKRLLACSDLMGIPMLDSIIVAGETGSIYSFRSEGLLDQLRPRNRDWER